MKKTGDGSARLQLVDIELLIAGINGMETFDGIASGINLSNGYNSPLHDVCMVVSPVIPPQIGSQFDSVTGLVI